MLFAVLLVWENYVSFFIYTERPHHDIITKPNIFYEIEALDKSLFLTAGSGKNVAMSALKTSSFFPEMKNRFI